MLQFILPKVIAHRGASGDAPENTLVAFQLAKEQGATWVEFDVMLTKDREAIVFHDETVEHKTNGKGKVSDYTLAEILQLDAGNWRGVQFAGCKIPTLKETLNFLAAQKMQMNIEIKPLPGQAEITAKKTIELVQQYWPQSQSTPLISSFNMESLEIAYQINSALPLAWIIHEWRDDFKEQLQRLHCISLHINQKVLTRERVQKVKDADYSILAYTVNDKERAQELFDWGVDGIFTDFPARMLTIQ